MVTGESADRPVRRIASVLHPLLSGRLHAYAHVVHVLAIYPSPGLPREDRHGPVSGQASHEENMLPLRRKTVRTWTFYGMRTIVRDRNSARSRRDSYARRKPADRGGRRGWRGGGERRFPRFLLWFWRTCLLLYRVWFFSQSVDRTEIFSDAWEHFFPEDFWRETLHRITPNGIYVTLKNFARLSFNDNFNAPSTILDNVVRGLRMVSV